MVVHVWFSWRRRHGDRNWEISPKVNPISTKSRSQMSLRRFPHSSHSQYHQLCVSDPQARSRLFAAYFPTGHSQVIDIYTNEIAAEPNKNLNDDAIAILQPIQFRTTAPSLLARLHHPPQIHPTHLQRRSRLPDRRLPVLPGWQNSHAASAGGPLTGPDTEHRQQGDRRV